MKKPIQIWMQTTIKQLLIVVIIPTITWGTSLFFLCTYWEFIIQNMGNISSSEIVFPFWVALLVLLIVYIGAMLILYVLVLQEEMRLQEELKKRYKLKI